MYTIKLTTSGNGRPIAIRYGEELKLFVDVMKKIQHGVIPLDLTEEQNKIVKRAGFTTYTFYKHLLNRISAKHLKRDTYSLLSAAVRYGYGLEEDDPRWLSLITRIEGAYFFEEMRNRQQRKEDMKKTKPSAKHGTNVIKS